MPHLPGVSEVWLQRTIGLLAEDTVALAVEGADLNVFEGLPIVTLYPRQPLWWRVLFRAGIKLRRPRNIPQGMNENLRLAIERYCPDTVVVHFLNLATELRETLQSFPGRVLVHAHGFDATWDFRLFESPEVKHFPPEYPTRVRQLASKARLIANSQFMSSQLQSIGIPADRVRLKYFGFDPVRTGSRERKNQLLFVGRLVEVKGPVLMLKVFERACEKGFEGSIRLIGDGYLAEACARFQAGSRFGDRMILSGPQDPAVCAQAYAESSLFVSHNILGPRTCQCEAFGVVFLEALANGLPVVSTLSGGIPEIVTHNETGLLSDPHDLEAQADNILALTHDHARWEAMAQRGRERVAKHFSVRQEKTSWKKLLAETE